MFPSIPNQINANALKNGSKIAIIEYNGDVKRTLSYSELWNSSLQLNFEFTKQLKRVAIISGNTLEIHVFYLACAIANICAVPINITFTPREISEVLVSSQCNQIWYEDRYYETCSLVKSMRLKSLEITRLPTVSELISKATTNSMTQQQQQQYYETTEPSSLKIPWAILHTSGTTSGEKKGVERNQYGTIAGMFIHQSVLKITENDVYFAVWPSYGISTFFFTFGFLYLNSRVILVDFDTANDATRSWDLLLEEEATFTTGSPLHFENWSRVARRTPSDYLRVALLSGSTISNSNRRVLADAFGERCNFCEAYGSTECGVITLSSDVSREGVGHEPSGIPRIKFHSETNEILVNCNSPMFMNGYVSSRLENKNSFIIGDYFRTGDVGKRDEKGNIHLLGRVDDRIGLPNGHDLYPAEVEIILCEVLSDRQIFVSFVNNTLCGIISGEPSDEVIDLLKRHAEENLAPLKRPTRYLFVKALPLTSTNKVKRKELAELVSRL